MKDKTLLEEKLRVSLEKNDPESIELAYQLYQRAIQSFLWFKTNDSEEAKDLCQETFILAKSAIERGKYKHQNNIKAWLTRIANNLFIDRTRRQKKLPVQRLPELVHEDGNSWLKSPDASWVDLRISGEVSDLIKELINHLPEEQRGVVIMRVYFRMTFKEISQETGVSINTSLGRMRYALTNLRKLIKARELNMEGMRMAS